MSKILLVEDNETIVKGLKYSLEQNGYEATIALNYKDGINLLNSNFDLVILDISLPDGNGYTLCKKIRETSKMPVLFLSAKDEEDDIVKGLELGAEDYVTKPFGVKELMARIDKILKRTTKKEIVVDNVKIDLDKAKVYVDNIETSFTLLEYKIIVLLFSNIDKLVKRATIIDKIWDIDGNFVNDNTLTVYIKRIREKLKNENLIKTVKGLGYMVESK